jgi:acyl-ACP thioesterase
MDERGRLRLDAVARFLQDTANEDVEETGWGAPEHLWVLRHIRADVVVPFLDDRGLELVTWCSGVATLAAGRRWSLTGDRGGHIEVDSVWIHLGPDARPARIDGFVIYEEATGGRRVSTRLVLPGPPPGGRRERWPLRTTDIDLLGHVNNAAYWEAVEDSLRGADLDLRRPYRALLDYRHPLDLGDEVELVRFGSRGQVGVAFLTGDRMNAVARLEALP